MAFIVTIYLFILLLLSLSILQLCRSYGQFRNFNEN